MKHLLLLSAVMLLATMGFADTINNFTGYNDGWYPFGDTLSATQTYGEVFTAPQGVNFLNSFSFYTGNPIDQGNIILGGYLGTWHGDRVGQFIYQSGQVTYDNAGNEQLTFNTNGAPVTPGQQYIVFLSTTNFHDQSSGSTFMSQGEANEALNGFAYDNNGGNWVVLSESPWQGIGLSPDLAVDLEFGVTPEPGTLVLLGTGAIGSFGLLRRKLL